MKKSDEFTTRNLISIRFLANEWFKIQSVKSQVVIPKWKSQEKYIEDFKPLFFFAPTSL